MAPLPCHEVPGGRGVKEAAQPGPAAAVHYSCSPLYYNQFHYDIVDEGEMNLQ